MTQNTATPVRQSIRINILRLAAIAAIPLIFLGVSPYEDETFFLDSIEILGVLLIIAGVLGRFWAILYIGGRKNREIMQTGPYSMMRHPLYTFSILAVFGFSLTLTSIVTTIVLAGGIAAILIVTAMKEEKFLRSEFGARYDNYAARVPMILPNPKLYQSPPTIEVDVRHLRGNLFDAIVFLGLIPLAEIAEWTRDAALVPAFVLY